MNCVQCGKKVAEKGELLRCFWCVEVMCRRCWTSQMQQCVRCARAVTEAPRIAKMELNVVKSRGGRPVKRSECDWCGVMFGARQMRKHLPQCPGRRGE